jgi:hypothetical protein
MLLPWPQVDDDHEGVISAKYPEKQKCQHYLTVDMELVIQDDRKVTPPIIKYLLMVAIQYNWIELVNTQYRCDYTRAHAGHVML